MNKLNHEHSLLISQVPLDHTEHLGAVAVGTLLPTALAGIDISPSTPAHVVDQPRHKRHPLAVGRLLEWALREMRERAGPCVVGHDTVHLCRRVLCEDTPIILTRAPPINLHVVQLLPKHEILQDFRTRDEALECPLLEPVALSTPTVHVVLPLGHIAEVSMPPSALLKYDRVQICIQC